MRKIPEEFENPIDNLIYKSVDDCCIYLKKLNFTPNMITTLSAIFGLLSIYFICQEKFILGGGLYFISYYFDCVDGYYARKYDMVTEFGDWYDHAKDVLVFAGIVWVLIYKKLYSGLIFLVPILLLTFIHFGCQEIYYDKGESKTLNFTKSFTKYFCRINIDNKESISHMMQTTKYFGCGTLILLFSVYIASYQFCKV